MSDEQRNTVWRFAIIFAFILCGFIAVMVKIIYVQTVERDAWLKVAEKQVPTRKPIQATRGNILDCNGQLLASSMPQYYMYMDTRVPALHEKKGALFAAHIDTLARFLPNRTIVYTCFRHKRFVQFHNLVQHFFENIFRKDAEISLL